MTAVLDHGVGHPRRGVLWVSLAKRSSAERKPGQSQSGTTQAYGLYSHWRSWRDGAALPALTEELKTSGCILFKNLYFSINPSRDAKGGAMRLLSKIRKDESGASLVEYTILIGILGAICVAMIFAVGDNIEDRFAELRDTLGIEPAGGGNPSSAAGGNPPPAAGDNPNAIGTR